MKSTAMPVIRSDEMFAFYAADVTDHGSRELPMSLLPFSGTEQVKLSLAPFSAPDNSAY